MDRAYSQVLESKLRHPLERPLFTAFVALNFALMGLSMFVVMKGSDWLKDHPRLAKHSGRVRTLALAAVFGPPAIVLLRNTRRAQIRGNSIRVSPRQFPLLYEILKRHCETLGISRMPELYISDVAIKEPSHAYSSWKRDYIVLGSTFLQPNLEAMRDVFGFLLGRELGRLRLGHANWLKDLLLVYVDKIPYVKNSLLRVFTYSEDRYGAWLAPDSLPGVVAIASGRRMAHEVDIEDYLRQVQEDRSPWGRLSVILSATPRFPTGFKLCATQVSFKTKHQRFKPMIEIEQPSRISVTPSDPPDRDMVWIPGGAFWMGSNKHYPEEAPAHRAQVDGFWMDRSPVTNARFQEFVDQTGYRTFAEIPPDPADYPGALPEMLAPGSIVFVKPSRGVDVRSCSWWRYTLGADWRHPLGPDSSIEGLKDHPVTHVAYQDVEAYARWAGKELPTEAEWEFAARGGLDGADFAWGDDLYLGGHHMANTWQGEFPWQNLRSDGYERTSPVGAFPANGYGLLDMIGNVWEWTTDWFQPRHPEEQRGGCCLPHNPTGGSENTSYDANQPHIRIGRKVLKGGSHLCAPNYCRRYRPAARFPHPVDTSTCHAGFRCIVRKPVDGKGSNGGSL